MPIIFDFLYLVLCIFYLPYLVIKGKWHNVYCVRFGFLDKQKMVRIQAHQNIWIHAVSVGEVLAIVGLAERLHKAYPNNGIVCTTVTKTGQALAKDRLKGIAEVIYAPLDFSLVVRKFIRIIQPEIFIAAETELWPNLYTLLNRKNIPITIVNGRISDNSFKGYKRFLFLTKPILRRVKKFCMQSALDCERIIELGAKSDNVVITGNIKFDTIKNQALEQTQVLDSQYQWLVAGSTHSGEEDILLDIYRKLAKDHVNLRLVLAPRHIERAEQVSELVRKQNYQPIEFSKCPSDRIDQETIIVVDVIGKLKSLYQQADLVFIGKTLKVGGGQNMIEPAQYGKPIFVGPLTGNFKDAMRLFLECKAIVQVSDEQELYERMKECLDDPDKTKQLSIAALQVVRDNQGVEKRTFEEIQKVR